MEFISNLIYSIQTWCQNWTSHAMCACDIYCLIWFFCRVFSMPYTIQRHFIPLCFFIGRTKQWHMSMQRLLQQGRRLLHHALRKYLRIVFEQRSAYDLWSIEWKATLNTMSLPLPFEITSQNKRVGIPPISVVCCVPAGKHCRNVSVAIGLFHSHRWCCYTL